MGTADTTRTARPHQAARWLLPLVTAIAVGLLWHWLATAFLFRPGAAVTALSLSVALNVGLVVALVRRPADAE